MAISLTKLCKPLYSISLSSPIHSISSQQLLNQSIKSAIESKSYQQIPDLLNNSNKTTSNPFSFLSNFPQHHTTKLITELLQSLLPLRPRSRPTLTYSYLLSFTLQSPNPLPLSLTILQRTLRSGSTPVPQTHLLLSSVWLHQRKQPDQTVPTILLQMKTIGSQYRPDTGTCNYLISSLCKVDQFDEAIQVLRFMSGAGCVPDVDSFSCVICPLCDLRKTKLVEEMMKEMVGKYRLSPRKEMVVKVIKSMRANKEADKAVEMVNFLEEMDMEIGFESYELVVETCLDSNLLVLAGKVALRMTNKGFIPYIKMRQKLFQELANAGQLELAYILRNRFMELNS